MFYPDIQVDILYCRFNAIDVGAREMILPRPGGAGLGAGGRAHYGFAADSAVAI